MVCDRFATSSDTSLSKVATVLAMFDYKKMIIKLKDFDVVFIPF